MAAGWDESVVSALMAAGWDESVASALMAAGWDESHWDVLEKIHQQIIDRNEDHTSADWLLGCHDEEKTELVT